MAPKTYRRRKSGKRLVWYRGFGMEIAMNLSNHSALSKWTANKTCESMLTNQANRYGVKSPGSERYKRYRWVYPSGTIIDGYQAVLPFRSPSVSTRWEQRLLLPDGASTEMNSVMNSVESQQRIQA
ncbi:MAG: hypothetical protein WCK15_24110 [Pirellula sp.]